MVKNEKIKYYDKWASIWEQHNRWECHIWPEEQNSRHEKAPIKESSLGSHQPWAYTTTKPVSASRDAVICLKLNQKGGKNLTTSRQ